MAVGKKCNKNYLGKDGLIYNVWIGNQTTATVKKTYRELEQINAQMRKEGRRALALSDITKLGKVTAGARREAYKLMRYSDFDRAAVFGNYFLFNSLISGLITASGMGFKVRLFHNLDKALEWLREEN